MIRISITGPESTGKSWLAQRLAEYYHTSWVPEFSREYLAEIHRPYDYDDILAIAQKQFERENAATGTNILFCDTDFCVTSIWCNVKYGKCHEWITEQLRENHYDLYLLCDIDLPWEYDPLREHPEMRSQLFNMYLDVMQKNSFNYRVVRGMDETRLNNAIGFIDECLNVVNK
jgi:NadR type nicotinamide-nucleotide adenylyltransferase